MTGPTAIRFALALLLVLLAASPAWAAAPTVATRGFTAEAANVTAGNAHTINLPADIVSGNLLIVVMGCRGSSNSVNALSGWTELTDSNTATGLLWIAYRFADGAEGSTIGPILAVTDSCGAVSFRITGAHVSQAPEVGTPTNDGTGTSTAPDPPSKTASWGAEDNLFIAAAGLAFSNSCTVFPSGYSNGQSQVSSGAAPGAACTAEKTVTATATDNPGAFTANAGVTWVANTIVVRPAAAAIGGGGIIGGGIGSGGIIGN